MLRCDYGVPTVVLYEITTPNSIWYVMVFVTCVICFCCTTIKWWLVYLIIIVAVADFIFDILIRLVCYSD